MELSRSESPYLLNIYHANDPNEDAYDVLKLISILANERAKANGKDATVLDFKFGTDIRCGIFDQIKTFGYVHSLKKLPQTYNGIRTQMYLQEKCRNSTTYQLYTTALADKAMSEKASHICNDGVAMEGHHN